MVGRTAAGWGGRGSVLNRGPQLGFHNDISGGHMEPSALQMGKLRRRRLQSLRREGPPISYSGSFIFPWRTLWPGAGAPCQRSLGVEMETPGVEGSWVTWPQSTPLLTDRGAPSPLSCGQSECHQPASCPC